MFKKIGKHIYKMLTHNYCDTCGLTKDNVYHDGGYISQCKKCITLEEDSDTEKKNLNNS